MKKEKLIAFWGYDLYPYCLWGEINDDGHENDVWIKQGRHYIPRHQTYVKAFLILGEDNAKELIEDLTRLKMAKKNEEERISGYYNDQLNLIMPDLPAMKRLKK